MQKELQAAKEEVQSLRQKLAVADDMTKGLEGKNSLLTDQIANLKAASTAPGTHCHNN